jgi:glycosyltransferase involved in cell wall biosynthesis
VDDGSEDITAREIQKALKLLKPKYKSKNLAIELISHRRNLGYGSAIKSGLKKANFDICAIIDSDATYKVDDLMKLYKQLLQEGNDMVVGNRMGHLKSEATIKKYLRILLKKLIEYMSSSKVPDLNSGLRLFKKSDISGSEILLSNRFSFTSTITLLYLLQQKNINYVEIDYDKRLGKTKVNLWSDGFTTVGQLLVLAAYLNPLKLMFPMILFLLMLISVFVGTFFFFTDVTFIFQIFLFFYLFWFFVFLALGLHVLSLALKVFTAKTNGIN